MLSTSHIALSIMIKKFRRGIFSSHHFVVIDAGELLYLRLHVFCSIGLVSNFFLHIYSMWTSHISVCEITRWMLFLSLSYQNSRYKSLPSHTWTSEWLHPPPPATASSLHTSHKEIQFPVLLQIIVMRSKPVSYSLTILQISILLLL